uniref:BOD1/SHG1 domain-containing protein n=1 Tax=Cyclopterus lumpus TaxID=8103 RepID=A0A8C3A2P2_CYCLU
MEGLPPGDPQLVSMIVSHLKTQGLFDQFRRDCLADVDTKPAYLNLKQRVDNFVSNHLSNHTWSPHLNKNQLRNNIRQLVLQSGMLEQGVDRIVAQVVDPKVNHLFRPQVERVVREFLSPGSCSEEGAGGRGPDVRSEDGGLSGARGSGEGGVNRGGEDGRGRDGSSGADRGGERESCRQNNRKTHRREAGGRSAEICESGQAESQREDKGR